MINESGFFLRYNVDTRDGFLVEFVLPQQAKKYKRVLINGTKKIVSITKERT
jgi:hypothetical protein